jgi:hypothetical protein
MNPTKKFFKRLLEAKPKEAWVHGQHPGRNGGVGSGELPVDAAAVAGGKDGTRGIGAGEL